MNVLSLAIAANNVTIDCNGFRLSKPAVTADTTEGIFAGGRRNITVRHCNVQGFRIGQGSPGAGAAHLVLATGCGTSVPPFPAAAA